MPYLYVVIACLVCAVIGFFLGMLYQHAVGGAMVYVPDSPPKSRIATDKTTLDLVGAEDFDDFGEISDDDFGDEEFGGRTRKPTKIAKNTAYGRIGVNARYGKTAPIVSHVLEPLIISQDEKRIVYRPNTAIRIKAIFLWGDRDVIVKSIEMSGIEQLVGGGAPIQIFDSHGRTLDQLKKELVDYNTILDTLPHLALPGLNPTDQFDLRYDGGQVVTAAIWYTTYQYS